MASITGFDDILLSLSVSGEPILLKRIHFLGILMCNLDDYDFTDNYFLSFISLAHQNHHDTAAFFNLLVLLLFSQ